MDLVVPLDNKVMLLVHTTFLNFIVIDQSVPKVYQF